MKGICASSGMNCNIWWFEVVRLSQDRGYQTVVRECPVLLAAAYCSLPAGRHLVLALPFHCLILLIF